MTDAHFSKDKPPSILSASASTAEGGKSEHEVWAELRVEAEQVLLDEPLFADIMRATILNQDCFTDALASRLARRLGEADLTRSVVWELCCDAFASSGHMASSAAHDLIAIHQRDPACRRKLDPFLFYKGYAALEAYRVAHWLWHQGRSTLALHIQGRVSETFGCDIHPAARIGSGVFIDHATGVVIGETSIVADDVSILQSVTLGGDGKQKGDRHPKIGRGVFLSVGAKVLGNIRIGDGATVAAAAVVLCDVPPRVTVAGVPARIVSPNILERQPAPNGCCGAGCTDHPSGT